MKTRRELLAQAERAWPRFLRSLVTGETLFPLVLRIGKTRLAGDYAARKSALEAFARDTAALGITVRWKESGHRRFEAHELPEHAAWESEPEYLAALGRAAVVREFREDVALLPPELHAWSAARPLEIVEHHGIWPELLRVVQWFRANPRCGLYLRQLPVEGVDTKFFERHRAILDALLLQDQPEAVDSNESRFEARHGLRWEEPLVRLRFLTPALQTALGFPVADLSVPAPVFRTLPLPRVNAIITENLRNFLALPPLRNAVAVLGGGDAAALLTGTGWLSQARILYWGDMDARGFSILGRLRAAYPAVESVLMDDATLHAHRDFVVKVTPYRAEVSGLTPGETAALGRLGTEGVWLEQERVPFAAAVAEMERLLAATNGGMRSRVEHQVCLGALTATDDVPA